MKRTSSFCIFITSENMEHVSSGWRRSLKKDLSALAVKWTPPKLSKSTFSPELYL